MINRNNYEEYLLMYIDGELSPADTKAVESFLQANPDVKAELALLQQTILEPETDIVFTDRDLLFRKDEGINLGNYQEYFLLYVDDELSIAHKESVETFVLKNPQLQDEFTLLKQTVLPPETIVFTNKEVLYRKEEKRRPVIISMRWASLAAAIMIGVIALVWVFNSSDKTLVDPNNIARDGKPVNNKTTGTSPLTQPEQTLPVTVNDEATLAAKDQQPNVPSQQALKVQQVQQPSPNNQVAVTVQPKNDKKPVDQQVPYKEPDPIAYNPNPINSNNSGTTRVTTVSTSEVATNNYVQPAIYTEELNTDDDKNKNLYVGALEINTDKVRGFFRKAGRFLSSKVKKDDGEKVQVANIEVNKLK